jgi:acyl-CoA reductase-like NAD-dependent aldehyde dehydrogenase
VSELIREPALLINGEWVPGTGGYKQSGVGREIGDYGISDVLQVKAVQL